MVVCPEFSRADPCRSTPRVGRERISSQRVAYRRCSGHTESFRKKWILKAVIAMNNLQFSKSWMKTGPSIRPIFNRLNGTRPLIKATSRGNFRSLLERTACRQPSRFTYLIEFTGLTNREVTQPMTDRKQPLLVAVPVAHQLSSDIHSLNHSVISHARKSNNADAAKQLPANLVGRTHNRQIFKSSQFRRR